MYMMEVEKLKLKYTTLKEKLYIKTEQADQAEDEYNKVAHKLQKAKTEAAELREEVETLSEQKLKIEESEHSLRQHITDSIYNTEKLRHTQTHVDARKEYENRRRQFLKQELQLLRAEQKRLDDMCKQMTHDTNATEEQLVTEEEKLKQKFRHMRELENTLSEIVEKGRLLQSREQLQFDQQDDMDERVYEMKRLLQQAEVRVERYEVLIAELETIFAKLGGRCEDVKEECYRSKKRLENLLDEIISF